MGDVRGSSRPSLIGPLRGAAGFLDLLHNAQSQFGGLESAQVAHTAKVKLHQELADGHVLVLGEDGAASLKKMHSTQTLESSLQGATLPTGQIVRG